MVRSLTFCLVAFGAVAVLTAQTRAQQPTTPQPATEQPSIQQPADQRPTNKVTYTGCLKPGTTPGTWTLENATIAAAGTASTATDRPVATSGVATSKETLGLAAKPTDNLKPHANHKIEVSGTLSPSLSMPTTPDTAPERRKCRATSEPCNRLVQDGFRDVSVTLKYEPQTRAIHRSGLRPPA